MTTALNAIAFKARTHPRHRFQNLYGELNPGLLTRGWANLNKRSAPGVDGVEAEDFGARLPENIHRIHQNLKANRFRVNDVKRVYIPKANGAERPLGLPTIEDKLVQQSVAELLQSIWEQDFLRNSYGYRPHKSAHQAVHSLQLNLQFKGYGYIVEADIKGFFDNMDHGWLLRMLEQRIDDKRLLNLINQWLKARIIEPDGRYHKPLSGTPQGGVISPVLANIYLHYVLDLWFEKRVKPGLRGRAMLIRYADDCAPRRRTGGCESSVQPCCTRDEGGPLGAAVQAEASNHLLLLHLKGVVVSEYGKGRSRTGQVRAVKSNASEPLMTCRKRRDDVKTGGKSLTRDKSGRNLSTAQAASGIKAARTRLRLLCGTWEPVTPMLGERCKWKPHEYLSTNAGYRGGATCSSEEGSVMELERRGCPIQPETRVQPAMGGHS
ncbi:MULTISPECIES: reverse transcriptase domain-containing protein [unclassified Microbulbifer]|uniref:reverse transcriptase domain-containing protein n=1 Tax=unclassified Microbulbifer TaxID=2619833 RepID=UPI0027E513F2|nr:MULTISPECIES: reverse transcriptase domain-containing protein [unclassified Microbulbifer]